MQLWKEIETLCFEAAPEFEAARSASAAVRREAGLLLEGRRPDTGRMLTDGERAAVRAGLALQPCEVAGAEFEAAAAVSPPSRGRGEGDLGWDDGGNNCEDEGDDDRWSSGSDSDLHEADWGGDADMVTGSGSSGSDGGSDQDAGAEVGAAQAVAESAGGPGRHRRRRQYWI